MSWTDTEANRDAYAAVAIVPCAGCGAMIGNPDGAPEAFCPDCLTPPAPRPACLLCGAPVSRSDGDPAGTRHRHCGRFLAALDARRAAWQLAAAAALALAVLTGTGSASAQLTRPEANAILVTMPAAPFGCAVAIVWDDHSGVATCKDGMAYTYDPARGTWAVDRAWFADANATCPRCP